MKVNGHTVEPSANLRDANLRYADLRYADLQDANLQDANLRNANLQNAYLQNAYLQGANLQGARVQGADLQDANLRYANLQGADLQDANLQGADLRNADLQNAYLRYADLQGARLPHFQIPNGTLTGWKKISNYIVELTIPADAKRTASLVGRKCRAEYAICKSIEGTNSVETRGVEYRPGATVRPDRYDPDPRIECTHGIHFFLTRREAEEW